MGLPTISDDSPGEAGAGVVVGRVLDNAPRVGGPMISYSSWGGAKFASVLAVGGSLGASGKDSSSFSSKDVREGSGGFC